MSNSNREETTPNRHSAANEARRNGPDDFWAQVCFVGASPDDCWEWTGRTVEGYGMLRYVALTPGSKRMLRAHQVAWALAHNQGVNEYGTTLHHVCENRACCNPRHLVLMTISDHVHHHKGYGCKIHGYQEWRTQPSGQQKCGICNRARTAALTARKKAQARVVPVGDTDDSEEEQ